MNTRVVIVGLSLVCGFVPAGCQGDSDGSMSGDGSGGSNGSDDGPEDEDDAEDDADDESEGTADGEGSGSEADESGGDEEEESDTSTQAPACSEIPWTSQIPRLTNTQYNRTVRDLLGVTGLTASNNALPSILLATDQAGGLSTLGWSGYTTVAGMISAQVMGDPTLRENFIKCDPAEETCLHDTIVEFGRRAFRRPLSEDEIERFEEVVAKGAEITPSGAPEEVAEALLYMFLVSPSFLQRSEISSDEDDSGNFVLSNHEVASRLSYMLWGSTPDEILLKAADDGKLETSAQILAQAERMLADDRARDMVVEFHRYYLMMGPGGRWDTAQKDTELFPAFAPAQVPLMAEETLRFFDEVTFSGGSFSDLLLSPVAFVNNVTAPLYDLDPADYGDALEQVTLDPDERPGFLTRAGFLNGYAHSTYTAPVLRGAFITKEIIGIPIDPPPPGADQTMLPDEDFATIREMFEVLTSSDDCASCHRAYINPPGFVMEGFDAAGAIQTVDALSGAPIDTEAEVLIDAVQGPVTVTDPADLMQKIAESPNAMRQYAKKWVGFAYERESDPLDACVVDGLADKMTAGGYTVLHLITDLTQTESFRVRAVEG